MAGWFYVLQLHKNSNRFKVGWTAEERLEKRVGEHRTIMPDLVLKAAHRCKSQHQEQFCIGHLSRQKCCQRVGTSEVFDVMDVAVFLQAIDGYFGVSAETTLERDAANLRLHFLTLVPQYDMLTLMKSTILKI